MHQRVAELAALVDGARCFRCGMAWNPAGKRELAKQLVQAISVAANIGIDFTVSTLKIGIRHHPRPAVSGTADVKDVEVTRADGAVEMRVDEIQSWRCAPVPKQPRFDMFRPQGFTQQGIVEQINLADRKIVCGTPVTIEQL